MLPRGGVADDVSYILLDTPVIPRLDLSDCRHTHLPVLPDATPTAGSSPAHSGHEGKGGQERLGPLPGVGDRDATCAQSQVQTKVTEVRTLVVDMRDLDKPSSSNRTQNDDDDEDDESNIRSEDVVEDPPPSRAARRSGGVLKGGGEYVSTGQVRPRPRVSFLLDAVPGQGREGEGMQIRVYAKPQDTDPATDQLQDADNPEVCDPYPRPVSHTRDHAYTNGLPPKRFRPLSVNDRRHPTHLRHIRHMQNDIRAHDMLTSSGTYRVRRGFHGDEVYPSPCSTPQLPSVGNASAGSGRRSQLFSFRRKVSADSAYSHAHPRESRSRRNFILPPNASCKQVKGQVRFLEEEMGVGGGDGGGSEPSSPGQRSLGTYSVSEHPPRAASSKPPLSRPPVNSATNGETGEGLRPPRIPSATSRAVRVREWLSVDSVPNSSLRTKTRPSTVSSASSSCRSRDATSRGPGSSRASSASVKAASDPGTVDLDNMDPVTLNLMARRAKGPSRYRYLAKLRSLHLNTPTPLN